LEITICATPPPPRFNFDPDNQESRDVLRKECHWKTPLGLVQVYTFPTSQEQQYGVKKMYQLDATNFIMI